MWFCAEGEGLLDRQALPAVSLMSRAEGRILTNELPL